MYTLDNFYKKISTIWQKYHKKSKGLFFMKHPVECQQFINIHVHQLFLKEHDIQIAIACSKFVCVYTHYLSKPVNSL